MSITSDHLGVCASGQFAGVAAAAPIQRVISHSCRSSVLRQWIHFMRHGLQPLVQAKGRSLIRAG